MTSVRLFLFYLPELLLILLFAICNLRNNVYIYIYNFCLVCLGSASEKRRYFLSAHSRVILNTNQQITSLYRLHDKQKVAR